jgi:hypothetical protein
MSQPYLFEPITLRGVTAKKRIQRELDGPALPFRKG